MATHKKKTGNIRPSTPAKRSRLRFFSDAILELRKAHWPTRQETLRLSLLVLIICVVLGTILGALDFGFTKLFVALIAGG